jgi:anti-sigma B factor antagonist
LIPDHLFTSASRLRIEVDETVEPIRVTLIGELDSDEAPKLVAAVTEAVRHHPGRPIGLDAADLEFLDSGGIRALITSRQEAEASGSRLTVTAVSTVVHQVLEITGLRPILNAPEPPPTP